MMNQTGDAAQALERLQKATSRRSIQRINRLLQEGLFFYRKDDKEMFDILSSRQSDFREFWNDALGYDVVIDEHVAYRRFVHDSPDPYAGFLNENIPKEGRFHFHWYGQGSRERIIVFLFFLRYYEEVLRKLGEAEHGEYRFLWHEFVTWMQDRLKEAFASNPERIPNPSQLHSAIRSVFNDLGRFRFIERTEVRDLREGERERLPEAYQEDHIAMYHALPGLLAYDTTVLTQSLIEQTYALNTPGASKDDHATEPLQ